MADLVRKYERIATESAPPTPSKSTSKRTMSLLGSEEPPGLPPSTPAATSGLSFTPSSEIGGCDSVDRLSCFWCDQLRSAVISREKRKRFLGLEAENVKIETEDKTCTDGNLRRETPASLDDRRRPETELAPADADASKVTSLCASEIEAYFSAVEEQQQKRFAEKYNYDVVKDVPLEGRYEWIPLHVGAVEETLKATGDGMD